MLAVGVQPPGRAAVTGSYSAQAGEVRDLTAVGTTLFAATQGGGLWRSSDAGATWSRVAGYPERYAWKVASPANATSIVYVASQGGLHVSTDGGVSYTQRTFDAVRAVAVDDANANLLIGVPGAGIYRSTDGGATFVDVSAGLDGADVRAIVFDGSGNAFAAVFGAPGTAYGGVFRLARGATSWQSWNGAGSGGGALASRYVTSLAVNSVALLAGTADGTGSGAGKVYRNTLGGPGWSNPGSAPDGLLYDVESLALDRSDRTGRSFLAGSRAFGVWRSIDDGRTWVQKSNGGAASEVVQSTWSIGTVPGSAAAVIGQAGAGLFRTTDIGASTPSWQKTSGLAADRVLSLANHASAAPATYYLGLRSGGVMRSTNAGATFTPMLAGFAAGGPEPLLGTTNAVAAHPSDANVVFAALRANGLYTWSGSSWVRDSGAPNVLGPQDLRYDATGATLWYTMFNAGGGVWRRNGGWSQAVPGSWGGGVGAARVFLASNGAHFALMFDDLPLRSSSGAVGTWTRVGIAAAPNDVGFMRLAFATMAEKPGAGGATLVAATNRGLYRSGDGGQNWARVQVITPAAMQVTVSALDYAPSTGALFAGDRGGGVWCSLDDGTTWRAAGQAGAPVIGLRWLDNRLHALTDGAGVALVSASCT